jgi:hypothetical protein
MNKDRLTISMTLIVLICFFLPWVQVSCGASKDTLSGVDLAREGHSALWLIPVLMIVLLSINLARTRKLRQITSALMTLVGGLVSTYLMNRERVRAEDTAGLIAVGLTGWFWLGLGSSVVLVIGSALQVLKTSKRTELRE